jgi:hypothetical protein
MIKNDTILQLIAVLLFSCGEPSNTSTQVSKNFKIEKKDNRTLYFPKLTVAIEHIPKKENVWIFILAGQSNMAGRGLVEAQDTIPNKRVLTLDENNILILAKEPLHRYNNLPNGLDCGLSFGRALSNNLKDSIYILLIPTAISGSASDQWVNDELHGGVKLLTNLTNKLTSAQQYGTLKGILWHQGESDANANDVPYYKERITQIFNKFRTIAANKSLPILIGELGSFSKNPNWPVINQIINEYTSEDPNSITITTKELKDKGDQLHFNSKSQRIMGQKFAKAYIELTKEQ